MLTRTQKPSTPGPPSTLSVLIAALYAIREHQDLNDHPTTTLSGNNSRGPPRYSGGRDIEDPRWAGAGGARRGGNWAAVMLVRSGLGHIRPNNFDEAVAAELARLCVICEDDGEGDGAKLEGADSMDSLVAAIKNTPLPWLGKTLPHAGIALGSGAKSDPTRIRVANFVNTIYERLVHPRRSPSPTTVKLPPLASPRRIHPRAVIVLFVRTHPPHPRAAAPLSALLHITTYVLCALTGTPVANPAAVRGQGGWVYEHGEGGEEGCG
ncbi:hypothetical protein B0H12DRAFT_1240173 [Mycena haematopus]|nr:hypothetical protein B0H12DRAFT_1240173 [Mycena haematopus]